MYDSILCGSVQHICRCGRNDSTNGSLAKNITLNASTKLKQTDSWADIMKISNGRAMSHPKLMNIELLYGLDFYSLTKEKWGRNNKFLERQIELANSWLWQISKDTDKECWKWLVLHVIMAIFPFKKLWVWDRAREDNVAAVGPPKIGHGVGNWVMSTKLYKLEGLET